MTITKKYYVLCNEEEHLIVKMCGNVPIVCFEDEKKDLPLLMYARKGYAAKKLHSGYSNEKLYLDESLAVEKYRTEKFNQQVLENKCATLSSVNADLYVKEVVLTITL